MGRSEIIADLNMIYWITSQKERDVQGFDRPAAEQG